MAAVKHEELCEGDKAVSEAPDFARQAEPRGSVHHEAPEHPAQQARACCSVQSALKAVSATPSSAAAQNVLSRHSTKPLGGERCRRVLGLPAQGGNIAALSREIKHVLTCRTFHCSPRIIRQCLSG